MADEAQNDETEREGKTATIYKGDTFTLKCSFDNPVSSGTVTVDWRDGRKETCTFSGTELLVKHIYTTAGRFTVAFSITDNKGWTITDTNTVIVLVPTQNDDQNVLNPGLQDLEKRIAVELGVEGSTEEEHLEIIDQATDAILKQIFLDTVKSLSYEDAEEYAKLIEVEASPEYINKFLNRKIPGYGEFTKKIVDDFLNELKEAGNSTAPTS